MTTKLFKPTLIARLIGVWMLFPKASCGLAVNSEVAKRRVVCSADTHSRTVLKGIKSGARLRVKITRRRKREMSMGVVKRVKVMRMMPKI
jgi:hypothetical protein